MVEDEEGDGGGAQKTDRQRDTSLTTFHTVEVQRVDELVTAASKKNHTKQRRPSFFSFLTDNEVMCVSSCDVHWHTGPQTLAHIIN